jgi:hypothetical protein
VPRQPFVEERVVGGEQIQDAAIGPQLVVHQQLGFPQERASQVLVELGEDVRIGRPARDLAEAEPLAGEVLGERTRARVPQHPADLRFDHARIREPPALGQRQQLVVRDAAPEEKRQARREVEVAQPVGRAGPKVRRIGLDAEQEVEADEHALERGLDPGLEPAGSSRAGS